MSRDSKAIQTRTSASSARASKILLSTLTRPSTMEKKFILWEQNIQRLPCPWFRRRYTDVLETVWSVTRWMASRHKRLHLQWFSDVLTDQEELLQGKVLDLPLEQKYEMIKQDFLTRNYYITGNMSKSIYSETCFFDGPDPDQPVTGLKKYIDATSKLFDRKKSKMDLLDICITGDKVVARWRLEGVLNLPWKPSIKAYTGQTEYTFNEHGLVARHIESWDIHVVDAFLSTLISPRIGAPPALPADVLRAEIERRKEAEVVEQPQATNVT